MLLIEYSNKSLEQLALTFNIIVLKTYKMYTHVV